MRRIIPLFTIFLVPVILFARCSDASVIFTEAEIQIAETEKTEPEQFAAAAAFAIVPEPAADGQRSMQDEEPDAPDIGSEITYVANTNTMKFHYPYCHSVEDINESHKQEFTGTRDDLIAQGFVPCKNCNP